MIGDCTGKILDHVVIFTKAVLVKTFTRVGFPEGSREVVPLLFTRIALPVPDRSAMDLVFTRITIEVIFDSARKTRYDVFHVPNYNR